MENSFCHDLKFSKKHIEHIEIVGNGRDAGLLATALARARARFRLRLRL